MKYHHLSWDWHSKCVPTWRLIPMVRMMPQWIWVTAICWFLLPWYVGTNFVMSLFALPLMYTAGASVFWTTISHYNPRPFWLVCWGWMGYVLGPRKPALPWRNGFLWAVDPNRWPKWWQSICKHRSGCRRYANSTHFVISNRFDFVEYIMSTI